MDQLTNALSEFARLANDLKREWTPGTVPIDDVMINQLINKWEDSGQQDSTRRHS